MSRGAKAVETSRRIRGLRVTEVRRAIAEGIRCNANPHGTRKIGTRFDDHCNIAGASDGESKAVGLKTKGAIAGVHCWVPEHRREVEGTWDPALFARQVIECHRATGIQRILSKVGRIALEVDFR